MRAIYAVWCYQSWQKAFNVKLQIFLMVDLLSTKVNAIHRKCQHHALLYILGETSQHQQSSHYSIHPCQMHTVNGNNQLLSWQLCFLHLLCWLYHTQWGHGLLVERQLSPNLNHWRDHKWGRMFWNILDLKQTINHPDQST